jgi:hypothetical protein
MALADRAELIVVAPGVRAFGEDPSIDKLIRRYGYFGTPSAIDAVAHNEDIANDLSAAAHLIHGSSEGRFKITYCPGELSKEEITAVGYDYASPQEMLKKYNPAKLQSGHNVIDGEEIFFVPNPGLGLWACRTRFNETQA